MQRNEMKDKHPKREMDIVERMKTGRRYERENERWGEEERKQMKRKVPFSLGFSFVPDSFVSSPSECFIFQVPRQDALSKI